LFYLQSKNNFVNFDEIENIFSGDSLSNLSLSHYLTKKAAVGGRENNCGVKQENSTRIAGGV